jgi:hypothetical protein
MSRRKTGGLSNWTVRIHSLDLYYFSSSPLLHHMFMMSSIKMYKFTYLLWQFNMMLDSGKYDDVTVSDIKEKIRNGTISNYLKNQFPDADFSMIEPDEWTYLNKEWSGLADAIDESRKMGVVNRGVSLLLAYTIDGLQSHPDNPRNK